MRKQAREETSAMILALSLRQSLFWMALLSLLATAPAHAGSWLFTITTKTPSTTTTVPSQTVTPWQPPNPQNGTTGYSAAIGFGAGPGQTVPISVTSDLAFHVALTWVPNGTLAQDPEPTILRVTETGTSTWSATGSVNNQSTGGSTPITGTGKSSLTGLTAGTKQYTPSTGFTDHDITFHGEAKMTLAPPVGSTAGGTVSTGFTYSISAGSISASLTVDQDQQIFSPAAATPLSATASFPAGFTIDSMKITVDGQALTATVPAGSAQGTASWPTASVANPSEHSITATAQIHDSIGALTLNSTDPPSRPNNTSGMGRPADDILADLRLQSLKFNQSIALSQDTTTPVASPEFTWTGGSLTPATANPAAYVQGSKPNWTLTLASSSGAALTGSATMGYLFKATATPNTTNPSTNQADPALTLYDNTPGSPTAPTVLTSPLTLAATTALNSWVASYTESFPTMTFYVEFTKLPTPVWRAVSSYGGSSAPGNTLYATVSTPTAPMVKPWVGVLSDACNWAKRTTNATDATTALTTGLYTHGTYNGGQTAFTDPPTDTQETFHLKSFLANSTPEILYGQCNDFSDFLVCLSNSLGANALKSQRSASIAEIQAGSHFQTNPITPAPVQGATNAAPVQGGWSYHQWANLSAVFDACLRFGGTTTVSNMAGPAFGSLYNTSLVASYQHPVNPPYVPVADWDPQAPFVPTIAN